MATAKEVAAGQIWTAKISGKMAKVRIVGPVGQTEAGRTVFEWVNTATNRKSKGTARKLRELVSAVPAPPHASAPPATEPLPVLTKKKPPRKKASPSKAPQQAPASGAQVARRIVVPVELWDRITETAEQISASNGVEYSPIDVTIMAIEHGLMAREEVLRSAGLQNPASYPSQAAQVAANALSASQAQTPMQVLQVVGRAMGISY